MSALSVFKVGGEVEIANDDDFVKSLAELGQVVVWLLTFYENINDRVWVILVTLDLH